MAYDENTAGLLRLVCDVRFALGDDGKRMQGELIEFCAAIRKDAERYRWLRDRSDNADAVVAFNEGAALDEQIDAEMSAAHPVPPNVRGEATTEAGCLARARQHE